MLHLLLFLHLWLPHHQSLQCIQLSSSAQMPGLNIGRQCTGVSNLLSLGLRSFQGRSKGCSLPATLDNKGTFRITCPGDTGKLLREEALLPPRPSPRAPDPRTREECSIQETTTHLATTSGQITNQGQGSSTSSGGPLRPVTCFTTESSTTSLAATSGQSSEMLLANLATATAARGVRQVCE